MDCFSIIIWLCALSILYSGPDLYDDSTSDTAGGSEGDDSGPTTSAGLHRKEKTPQQVIVFSN